MMRAIQTRAPTRSMIRLLGTSKMKYPIKKIPAPNPYTAPENPRSSFICNAANPTFTRSRNAMMYSTNMNGIKRNVTFASVARPTAASFDATISTALPRDRRGTAG